MLSNELKLLRNAPLPFLKKYWLSPSSQYSQYKLPDQSNPAFYARSNVFQGQKGTTDSLLTISQTDHKIAYGNLIPAGGDSYTLHFYNGSILSDAQKDDMLPMWFLPWWEDHVTKMRILPADQMPPGLPNPSIFFTSALTGCSVFVKGPANSPTVYHAGFNSNRDYTAQPKLDPDSTRHWQILFDRYSPNTPNRGEANKTQYLAQFNDSPDLQAYLHYLKGTAKGNLQIQTLVGEGSFFGLRDAGGNWKFYLQESVTVQYRTFTIKKKIFGPDQTIWGQMTSVRRPMLLREIFPGGPGSARIWNHDPIVI